ncbi:hypothetical protein GMA12_18020 [Kocuria sediminis]|uniref:Oligosaccharide flippase family protein n=1 Tax=Kocuria sediminis TaxID=1038857 RepID=A0A6N8GQ46_9MICC|nr:hypothetical protein [Kocuria sediminis]MUN65008.1 hypothetical protein [Kocuria sediminis]
MILSMSKHFFGIVAGRVVASGAQALTVLLFARWSTPATFGLVIAVETVLATFVAMATLGLPQYVGAVRARMPGSPMILGIMRLNQKISWAAFTIVGVALVILGSHDAVYLMLLPLAVDVGLDLRGYVLERIVVADGHIGLFSSNLVIRRITTLGVFGGSYLLRIDVILGYCVAVTVGQVIYNARLMARSPCDLSPQKPLNFALVFRESKHYWFESLSGMIRQLDIVVVGMALGSGASGYFAVASRAVSPLLLVPSSFATLLLPRVSAGGARTARAALILACGVTVTMAVALAAVSWSLEDILRIFLGEAYVAAGPVTRIYFVGFVGLSFALMLGAILQGLGLHSSVGRLAGACSLLTLSLLWVGGYLYGLESAAWGFVIGVWCQTIGLVYLYVFRFRGNGAHIR